MRQPLLLQHCETFEVKTTVTQSRRHVCTLVIYDQYFTNVSETWSLTKGDSRRLISFERKVLINIFGPSYNVELQTYE